MALTATVRRFRIELSDVDRGVYDALDLRVAQHPSENERFLVTRVLAYALNACDGLRFSAGGVSSDEEPAVLARDATGALTLWIEVGQPSAERLGKAVRACKRVQVWSYKSPLPWLASVAKAGIPRAEDLFVYAPPADFVDALERSIGKNNSWTVVRNDDVVHVSAGDVTVEWSSTPRALFTV